MTSDIEKLRIQYSKMTSSLDRLNTTLKETT